MDLSQGRTLTELVSSLLNGKRKEVLLASPLSVLHLGRYQLCEQLDRILQIKAKQNIIESKYRQIFLALLAGYCGRGLLVRQYIIL